MSETSDIPTNLPAAAAFAERSTKYDEGAQAAQATALASGIAAAQARVAAAMPPGVPFLGSIEEFRYWSGWRKKLDELGAAGPH